MRLRYIFAIAAMLSAATLGAENFNPSKIDTLAIKDAAWNVSKGAPGIKVKTAKVNIFGIGANLSVVVIPTHRYRFTVALHDHDAMDLDVMCELENASAGINGTYFRYDDGTVKNRSTECFYSKGGEVICTTIPAERSRTNGVILFGRGGIRIRAVNAGSDDSERILASQYNEVLACGPILVKNGQRLKYGGASDGDAFYTGRHARSVIGSDKKGNVIMLTADSSGGGVGLTIAETGFIAQMLGMEEAINLDGGGSTTVWTKDLGAFNSYNGGGGVMRSIPNAIIAY